MNDKKVSKNEKIISKKNNNLISKEKGERQMNEKNIEDMKDTALKLDKIRSYCPDAFCYIEGLIRSLLNRKEISLKIAEKAVQLEKDSKLDSQTL